MGSGLSSEKMRNQESYVMKNLESNKSRMSGYRNYDGSNRYSENQIKMKLRQEYNSNGYMKNRIDKNDYINYSHWDKYRNNY